MSARESAEAEEINDVVLRGRLSAAPQLRTLPSGDEVWTCRVVVRRPAVASQSADAPRAGAGVDALECAAWTARARRSLGSWRVGDVVEVRGRLRRRFYRSGAATLSRVEVEVERARLIRRPRGG